ncbi:hypothetical protein BH09ACT1_BH09ACT1_18050 [soil metagenome]
MTSDESRQELERAAFGRPTTPEQARKAELALQALIGGGGQAPDAPIQIPDAAAKATPTRVIQPTEAAAVVAPFTELRLLSEVDGAEKIIEIAPRARRPVSFWIALTAVISLVAGSAIGWGISAYQVAHPANPSSVIKAGPGDVDAANRWFQTKLTTDPEFPEPFSLTSIGIKPAHVRYVQYVSSGAIWVGKTRAGYCLLFTGIGGNGLDDQTTCSSAKEFQRVGLTLYRHNESFTWNGSLVNVIVASDGGSVK